MAIDFNPMSDINCEDPFSLFRRLRDEAPVHWSAKDEMFDKDSPLTLAVFHGVPPRINQHPAEKPIKLTENENGILEEKA